MKNFEGRKRAVIENIQPQIDCGKYPAKRTTQEPFVVTADVFADGHDVVRAKLLYRPVNKRKWQEIPMTFLGNDKWEAGFTPDEIGIWEYTIHAWVDHFASWQKGLVKKFEDGQDVRVELQIGLNMMQEALSLLPPSESRKLNKLVSAYSDTNDPSSAVSIVTTADVSDLMYLAHYKNPDITEYTPYLQLKVERERARFSAWYEFFPRSASPNEGQHGTFKDCIRLLPRIADMGFDVIYFPPIHPIGKQFRKGKNNSLKAELDEPGSPWAIGGEEGGHKSIHPDLGTEQDFIDLVNEAKKYQIEIALDYALQCSPDHPYVKKHPQWFKWRPDGTVQYAENPPKKYQDVLPLNYENDDWQNMWKELKSIVDYWIDRGVKIFRVDNPHTKSFDFWEWMIGEIHKKNPEVIFLAEAFTRPRVMERLAKIGFTQSYTYFTWRVSKEELQEYATELSTAPLKDFFRPNFWPNTPDILPPHLTYGGESAHLSRMILAATMSSNWGMYGPVYEFGINKPMPTKEEYVDNEKYEIKHWDWDRTTRISETIKKVNQIRKQNPALHYTSNIVFGDADNPQLLCFAKISPDRNNIVLVIVNIDYNWKQAGWVKVPLFDLGLPVTTSYKVHDLLSGHTYHWHNEWNYVELDPQRMPAHIMQLEIEQNP